MPYPAPVPPARPVICTKLRRCSKPIRRATGTMTKPVPVPHMMATTVIILRHVLTSSLQIVNTMNDFPDVLIHRVGQ
jgi:hypothetical protein